MKKLSISLLIIFLSILPISANSLWDNLDNNTSGYYSEMKGHNIGDNITVIIVESATASNKAVTQNKKSTSVSGSAGTGPLKFLKEMGSDVQTDFQGDGATSRTTILETRITAKVTKIYPNGNLYVEGKKFNQINSEIQEVIVKGIIRPVDIAADNTVYSTSLADADIRLVGHGTSSETARPGILNRIMNTIF